MKESAELFYSLYTDDFIDLIKSEDFYTYFTNAIKGGKKELALSVRYSQNDIDLTWVEAIEKSIVPLDNIIRNPRRFIEQIEEIVPIEQARRITNESIRHLAQHTNMIAKVDESGVTPDKILNIYKEESFATYENRFIYTLLINLQYFIDKRLKLISDSGTRAVSKISMNNQFNIGREELKFAMSLTSVARVADDAEFMQIDADTSKLDAVTRIERIRKILYDFQDSALIKSLYGCALVKPPIMRTNVLLKNPDFKAAMALWQFIETYRDTGLSVQMVESNELPSPDYISQLYSILALNYCLLKHHTKTKDEMMAAAPVRKEFRPTLIRNAIEEYVNDLTMDVDTVQRIFVEEIKRSAKKRLEEEDKIKKIIERALLAEKKRKDKLKALELEAAEKEKKRKLREKEQAKKAREKVRAKQRREAEKAKAKEKRKKEQEKKKQQREKAKAKAKA
ncbi:MAG: DUF2357 domain-containing protein [Clostridia bacterium]|nr:DUF2357 domain-containing protein [Clostridia bacterium]